VVLASGNLYTVLTPGMQTAMYERLGNLPSEQTCFVIAANPRSK
jgi:hypothetical protein